MLKEVGTLSLAALLGAITSLVALPVVTRMYSVGDFAEYGLLIAFVSVISVVSVGRMDQAILSGDDEDAGQRAFVGIIYLILVSFIFVTISFSFFDIYELGAIAVNIISIGVYQLNYSLFYKRNRINVCAFLTYLRTSFVPFSQIAIYYLIDNATLVDGIYLYSSVLLTVNFYSLVRNLSYAKWSKFCDLWPYAKGYSLHGLINSGSHNVPYFLLGFVNAPTILGFYTIIDRLCKGPLLLVSGFVRQYYTKRFSKNITNESRSISIKSSSILLFISVLAYSISITIPDNWFVWVLGGEWAGISFYFPQLAIAFVFIFMNPPLIAFWVNEERFDILVKYQVVEVIVKCILFWGYIITFGNDYSFIILSLAISQMGYNFLLFYSTVKYKGI